ncbi:MAG: NADH:flavin oxidoreductase [Parasphingorhabdus sp.]|uniref:NADH:flavin oxidoreductase n=1 Tax=Parasphingorhabdus sp. TaxID=2709688 RepID=UPI0032664C02
MTSAFSPLQIGPLKLRNRFVKAATNEGMAKGGIVTKGLANFHARIAEGGAALSTVAYCATSPDGRTFLDQAVLDDDSIPDFRALTEGVHKHGAAASAQITHAGSFTFLDKETLKTNRPLSSSGGFNKVGVMSGRYFKKKMDRDDLSTMTDEFVAAALRAKEAGFDAVELHMGHGYLLSQFVSPVYNKRRDDFGGSIEKRMNFPSEVLKKVLDAVGKDLAVIVKYSMTDGPKGNQIDDGIAVAKRLEADGAHMAVLSNGLNVESITAMFGSPLPPTGSGGNAVVKIGSWIQSLTAPKDVVFRESYLRELAQQVRANVNMPLAYLGGVQSLAGVEDAMADGFDTIAMGRALVFDPNFVNDLQTGAITQSGCTACNRCVTMMYTPGGTSCIESPYKPDPKLNKVGASV